MPDNQSVKIETIGHKGDGIVRQDGKTIAVPFTLPGEKVEISPLTILSPSGERQEPCCQHFGQCGGCQLQHWSHAPYLAWKTSLLRDALEGNGINEPIQPILSYPSASRRRLVLSTTFEDGHLSLGYSKRSSNQIIDLQSCPIGEDAVNSALAPARELCQHLLAGGNANRSGKIIRASVQLLACDNGCDFNLMTQAKIPQSVLTKLPANPASRHFIRLTINGETIFEFKKPIISCGIARVTPPPNSFIQANQQAENDMADLVISHLAGCKQTADLFCGFGPFALRLAQNSKVLAFESDTEALGALDEAWRNTAGKLRELSSTRRDLFRSPVRADELKKTNGVVFDPPRAGAEAQCRQLAKSKIKKIAAISCNPQTLARDLAVLIKGGYAIKSIHPIDQFRFTPHLETVVLLEK